ncbi:MAG: hypothetical protein RL685_2445 [Pseudomonadota bacterium]|jgi:NAD(P)-dependent dehydrogenase (short-subunit alcohol dehydrogenase family)
MIEYDYSGKVAFLTGGASGIGLATALAFARSSARQAWAAIWRPSSTRARTCGTT